MGGDGGRGVDVQFAEEGEEGGAGGFEVFVFVVADGEVKDLDEAGGVSVWVEGGEDGVWGGLGAGRGREVEI